jgi:hypothetical protein
MGEQVLRDISPTLDQVVRAIQSSIDADLERAREIRSMGISPQLLEELLTLRFRKSRLERRLDALLDGGLLALSVRRAECPVEILAAAIGEIERECSRVGVIVRAELESSGPLRIDGNQVTEAIRGILEDLLDGLAPGSTLDVLAKPSADGGIEVLFAHQGDAVVPTLAASGIAYLLSEDPWSGLQLTPTREPVGLRLTVNRAPDVVPNRVRRWLFPMPAA